MAFKAPWISKEELADRAVDFLRRFNPHDLIPVDIEFIVESDFGIDIVPMPGLQRGFDVVAFISKNQREIWVDEYVYQNREQRYRFSLAHELAHKILHPGLWEEIDFHDIRSWKNAMTNTVPDKEYSYIEFHANFFAGCVLVPTPQLIEEFERCVESAKQGGIIEINDAAIEYIESRLGVTFNVSSAVIHRRLEHERLT